jgi:hypothetical protein
MPLKICWSRLQPLRGSGGVQEVSVRMWLGLGVVVLLVLGLGVVVVVRRGEVEEKTAEAMVRAVVSWEGEPVARWSSAGG